MRKSTRIVKRCLAVFLVVLMSIENFAAVVGDNDGAAFITKAEFDSLKNNFQSQIDQYNISIDSKIDGAIASYLSGIKTQKKENIQLNIDKIKDKVFFWNSATNFAYHPNRPLFSIKYLWGEYYLTTAFQIEYNRSYDDYYIESGTLRDGSFVVDEIAKWNNVCDTTCEYFFGGQDDEGLIGGRWPVNAGWAALSTISLSKQSGWGNTLWDMNTTRAYALDPTNTGGWRYSNSYVALSSVKVATSSIVLAPFSSAETYVRDTGNETNQTETIERGNSSGSFVDVYFTDPRWGEVVDKRQGTLQTKDPKTLTRNQYNRWADINNSQVVIPWLTKKYKVRDLKFKTLINGTGVDKQIKYGLCLFTSDKDGTYDLTFTATDNGYGLFYVGSNSIDNWGTPSSHVAGVNYINCIANNLSNIKLDTKKGESLYFIYYPTDPAAISNVKFEETYFTAA